MIIAIGSDHGGFHLKQEIIAYLKGLKHKAIDVGVYTADPSD